MSGLVTALASCDGCADSKKAVELIAALTAALVTNRGRSAWFVGAWVLRPRTL
jgi:hypothetical protein